MPTQTKTIALEGIKIVAPIGFFDYEREKQNIFVIDIAVVLPWVEKKDHDNLENTLNYEEIYSLVNYEMSKECKMMEDVADRILQRILKLSNHLNSVSVRIRKKNPPLNGKVDFSKVELNWIKD